MEVPHNSSGETVQSSAILGLANYPGKELKIKTYDFKRPDKFSLDQIRTISIMHETFARVLAVHLSVALRLQVQAHVSLVDQMTYAEFIDTLPPLTCLAVTRMDPLKGEALIQCDTELYSSFLDRLFGGSGQSYQAVRPLTEIENETLSDLIRLIVSPSLGEAWKDIIPLSPQLECVESNREFAMIVPPSEMIVLVSLTVTCNDKESRLNLCLPFLTIEPIIGKLRATYWYSLIGKKKNLPLNRHALRLAADTELYYPAGELTLEQISAAAAGSPLPLPACDQGKAVLAAGGVPVLEFTQGESGFMVNRSEKDEFTGELLPAKKETPPLRELFLNKMENFRQEIKTGFTEIETKMEALFNRQEELSDQMLLGLPESERQEHPSPRGGHPFEAITTTDCDHLYLLLRQESHQLAALILSYIPPESSSLVLGKFPPEDQVEIIRRISVLDRTHPQVIKKLEQHFTSKLKQMAVSELYRTGGVLTAINILNHASRSVERTVIEALEKQNPELAESIKRDMFVFEDIVVLDQGDLEKVLANTDPADLALALKKNQDPELKKYIYSCLDEKARADMESRLKELVKVRLKEVDESQQRIVLTIRRLDESGVITVARKDDLLA